MTIEIEKSARHVAATAAMTAMYEGHEPMSTDSPSTFGELQAWLTARHLRLSLVINPGGATATLARRHAPLEKPGRSFTIPYARTAELAIQHAIELYERERETA